MNIQDLFPVSRPLEILLPNGEPTGITFTLRGIDSKEFKEASFKFAAKRAADFERIADKKNAQKALSEADIRELKEQQVELTVTAIVHWRGVQENDQEVPFTKEKARELLSKEELGFIVEQIEGFVTQRGKFFRGRAE